MGSCFSCRRKRCETEHFNMEKFTRETFLQSYHRQSFSLPETIMFYIAKNPNSSKMYQKFVERCKYFYIKNPIIILPKLFYINGNWKIYFLNRYLKSIELNQMLCKFWLIGVLVIYPENQEYENPIELLKPKIYKCDIKCLRLKNSVISLNEFHFLASKCEEIWFDKSAVKNEENDTIVSLAELVQIPENLINFMYCSPSNFGGTVKEFQNYPNVKLFTFQEDFKSF